MRSRQRLSVVTIASLIASLTTLTATSPAFADDEFPVPSSNTLSGPVVYTAGISGALGPSEVTVVARAWPSNATLDALPEGAEFENQIVSYGTRGGNGSVALKIASTVDTTPYVNEDGTMNITLFTYVGDELRDTRARTVVASTSSTADLAPFTAPQTSAEPSTTETVTEPTVISSGGGGTTRPTNTTTLNRVAPSGSEQTAAVSSAEATTPDSTDVSPGASTGTGTAAQVAASSPCGAVGGRGTRIVVRVYKKGSPAPAIIGQTFSNTSASLARWTFKRGQSSTFGVAMGASYGALTVNAGYTNLSSTNLTLTYPNKGGAHAWFYTTQYRSDAYQRYCYVPSTGRKYAYAYEVRPVSHFGGGNYYSTPNKPNARTCAYYAKGLSQDLDRGKAITWSNGLKVAGLGVELSLSAQTGYTSNASVYYKANTAGMYVCGNGAGPAEDAAKILAASKTSGGW